MGKLEVRDEAASGLRHYLAGRPVHAGDALELLLPGERWIAGRYEWTFTADRQPMFYFPAGGAWEQAGRDAVAPVVSASLPAGAVLRWPEDRPR